MTEFPNQLPKDLHTPAQRGPAQTAVQGGVCPGCPHQLEAHQTPSAMAAQMRQLSTLPWSALSTLPRRSRRCVSHQVGDSGGREFRTLVGELCAVLRDQWWGPLAEACGSKRTFYTWSKTNSCCAASGAHGVQLGGGPPPRLPVFRPCFLLTALLCLSPARSPRRASSLVKFRQPQQLAAQRGFPFTVSHSPAVGSLMLRHRRPPILTWSKITSATKEQQHTAAESINHH